MQLRQIGRGSFARVSMLLYDGQVRAIKKIGIKSDISYTLILNEASILSICRHPNIVKYLNSHLDPHSNHFMLQLEYIQGGTLSRADHINNYPLLIQWITQICSGLAYLHSLGVIHRDIKLTNLMLTLDNEVKIVDFGVSTCKWNIPYEGVRLIGSPCYMAPEMFLCEEYDQKVDIYALGVCLYQLTHGELPYKGKTKKEYWDSTLNSTIHYNQKCPTQIVKLMQTMLNHNPRCRPSAAEVLGILSQPDYMP